MDQPPPPGGFEIVIADNGSTDDTWTVARDYADQYSTVATVREDEIQGSYAARNRGIERARAELICFVDADMTAPPQFLQKIHRRFADGHVDYLACDVEITPNGDSVSSAYNCLTGFPIRRYLDGDHYAPTCCLSVHRRCIDEVGPFDARLESGGDMEFGQRVFRAGFQQSFAPEIVLRHPARRTYASLAAKQKRIGRGHAQLSHFYPERYSLFFDLYVMTSRYFLPGNPLRHLSRAKTLGLEIGLFDALGVALLRIPLAWAGLGAYLAESRRLRQTSSDRGDSAAAN